MLLNHPPVPPISPPATAWHPAALSCLSSSNLPQLASWLHPTSHCTCSRVKLLSRRGQIACTTHPWWRCNAPPSCHAGRSRGQVPLPSVAEQARCRISKSQLASPSMTVTRLMVHPKRAPELTERRRPLYPCWGVFVWMLLDVPSSILGRRNGLGGDFAQWHHWVCLIILKMENYQNWKIWLIKIWKISTHDCIFNKNSDKFELCTVSNVWNLLSYVFCCDEVDRESLMWYFYCASLSNSLAYYYIMQL